MVWTTKSLERERNYVVIKHALKDMNGNVAGIKFRGGYAVVEKDSKAYSQLKTLPLIKNQEELPLIFLRKLPFITRTADVKMVFGQDVYSQYVKLLAVEIAKEAVVADKLEVDTHINQENKCAHITALGNLCIKPALKGSPSKYCSLHIIEDPQLESIGIVVPRILTKKEKWDYREKVAEKLEKMFGK